MIDGTVVTPPLGGTILPGITRDSVLTLLNDMTVPELEGLRSGRLADRHGWLMTI